jgi:hypothetical protein
MAHNNPARPRAKAPTFDKPDRDEDYLDAIEKYRSLFGYYFKASWSPPTRPDGTLLTGVDLSTATTKAKTEIFLGNLPPDLYNEINELCVEPEDSTYDIMMQMLIDRFSDSTSAHECRKSMWLMRQEPDERINAFIQRVNRKAKHMKLQCVEDRETYIVDAVINGTTCATVKMQALTNDWSLATLLLQASKYERSYTSVTATQPQSQEVSRVQKYSYSNRNTSANNTNSSGQNRQSSSNASAADLPSVRAKINVLPKANAARHAAK